MADQEKSRSSRRPQTVSKKKRADKTLSKGALGAITKNDKTAEDFITALEEGDDIGAFSLGKVIGPLGGGRFKVKVAGQSPIKATLEGVFVGKGKFWKNPAVSTAVHAEKYVVVEDIGLGHMATGVTNRIVAILDDEQAARAMAVVGTNRSGSSNSLFNRSSERQRIASQRAAAVASAGAALASLRRGTSRRGRSLSSGRSSRRSSRSSSMQSSSGPNLAGLSENAATAAKAAKAARRKETRRAKKAAATGGGAAASPWSWFS